MAKSLSVTPLFELHREAGARFVPFAGYRMPVQYEGIIQEHTAVRTNVGLFDVSHMGELEIRGPGAVEYTRSLISNNFNRVDPGQAQYTAVCREDGGILDDVIAYRFSDDFVMICMNASNRQKIADWFISHAPAGLDVADRSDDFAQIAIQGPRADEIVRPLLGDGVCELTPFRFAELEYDGARAVIARTGYTGESGFEAFLPGAAARTLWRNLSEHGAVPCGLGSRDTLRLEMGYCLYGNDINESTNPLEAGLGWVTKLKSGDFIGREALKAIKKSGVARKLVGFRMLERAIPRQHYGILVDGELAGEVTSGTMSLTMSQPIGMGYVPIERSSPGSQIQIQVRKRVIDAEVVRLPFYNKEETPQPSSATKRSK